LLLRAYGLIPGAAISSILHRNKEIAMTAAIAPALTQFRSILLRVLKTLVLVVLVALPEAALAQNFSADACKFISNIRDLLAIASILVIAIAIVFAGYQIVFAHKRWAEVAPVLISGILISAASQVGTWLLSHGSGVQNCANALLLGMAGHIA